MRRGGYQQANDLGNLFLKEEVQLCRHHAYQEGYDNTALKSHQIHAQAKQVQGSHLHGSLGRRIGVCQTGRQHNTSHDNTQNRPSAEAFTGAVGNGQGKETEDRPGGNIDKLCDSEQGLAALHRIQIGQHPGKPRQKRRRQYARHNVNKHVRQSLNHPLNRIHLLIGLRLQVA